MRIFDDLKSVVQKTFQGRQPPDPHIRILLVLRARTTQVTFPSGSIPGKAAMVNFHIKFGALHFSGLVGGPELKLLSRYYSK